jgi:hypothetical protein
MNSCELYQMGGLRATVLAVARRQRLAAGRKIAKLSAAKLK